MKTVKCKHCQEPFIKTREWNEFCSSKCRYGWHIAQRAQAGQNVLELLTLQQKVVSLETELAELRERYCELHLDLRDTVQRLRVYEPELAPVSADPSVKYIISPGKQRTPPQPIPRKLPID